MQIYRGERLPADSQRAIDLVLQGISAHEPNHEATVEKMIEHIIDGSFHSPFVSATRSRRVALQYATDRGIVYEIQSDDAVRIIDPSSAINRWLVECNVWQGELYSRAREAIDMAEPDEELFFVGSIPSHLITKYEIISNL